MLLSSVLPPVITRQDTFAPAVAVASVIVIVPSVSHAAISAPAFTVGAATKVTLLVKVCASVHGASA